MQPFEMNNKTSNPKNAKNPYSSFATSRGVAGGSQTNRRHVASASYSTNLNKNFELKK